MNWIVADVVLDTKKIISSINNFKPDYIIDFMGQGMVAQSWDSPNQWYNTNITKKSEMLKGLNWKEFLKGKRIEKLDPFKQKGLIGELLFLEYLSEKIPINQVEVPTQIQKSILCSLSIFS